MSRNLGKSPITHDERKGGKKLDGSSTLNSSSRDYVPRQPVIPKEGRGTDDGRDTLNKRTKWAEVLMPIAVVTMCVCCGRRGKEAKKEAADFLGSFPPHYVSSVAEKMTRGGGGSVLSTRKL